MSSQFQRTKLYRGYSSQPSNYIPLKFFNIDTSNYVGNLTSRGGHRPRPGRSQTRCCSSLRARIHDPGYHNREAAPRRQACNVLHTMWKSGRYALERRGRARGEARRRCEGHARKATRIVTALSLLRTPLLVSRAGLPMNGIPTASRLVHCRSPPSQTLSINPVFS